MTYRGEVTVRMKYIPGSEYYKPMDRIAQIMVVPTIQLEFEEVDELNDTSRGEGGYGSTGIDQITEKS